MKFGEKVKELRIKCGLSQAQLADAAGVSARTVRGWESQNRYPRYRDQYQTLAEVLGCETDYLLTEDEAFITEAASQYGDKGARQAQSILEQTAAMFAGGELSDEDQLAFLTEIQSLYLDSKKRAGRFTPKKYLEQEETH